MNEDPLITCRIDAGWGFVFSFFQYGSVILSFWLWFKSWVTRDTVYAFMGWILSNTFLFVWTLQILIADPVPYPDCVYSILDYVWDVLDSGVPQKDGEDVIYGMPSNVSFYAFTLFAFCICYKWVEFSVVRNKKKKERKGYSVVKNVCLIVTHFIFACLCGASAYLSGRSTVLQSVVGCVGGFVYGILSWLCLYLYYYPDLSRVYIAGGCCFRLLFGSNNDWYDASI